MNTIIDTIKPIYFGYNFDCFCYETDEEINPMKCFFTPESREACWAKHLCDITVYENFKIKDGKLRIGSFLWCEKNKVLRFAAIDAESDDIFTDQRETHSELSYGSNLKTPWSEYINLSTTYIVRRFTPVYFSKDFPKENDWQKTLYGPENILKLIESLVNLKGKHKMIYMHNEKVNNSYMCKLIEIV